MDKITITWVDHYQENGDFTVDEISRIARDNMVGTYCGFLVYENDEFVVISNNIWEDGSISDPMFIMKRAIIKREGA